MEIPTGLYDKVVISMLNEKKVCKLCKSQYKEKCNIGLLSCKSRRVIHSKIGEGDNMNKEFKSDHDIDLIFIENNKSEFSLEKMMKNGLFCALPVDLLKISNILIKDIGQNIIKKITCIEQLEWNLVFSVKGRKCPPLTIKIEEIYNKMLELWKCDKKTILENSENFQNKSGGIYIDISDRSELDLVVNECKITKYFVRFYIIQRVENDNLEIHVDKKKGYIWTSC